jgi:hypothetical protein
MDHEPDFWSGIDGQGTLHDLAPHDEPPPRLAHMRSVSPAAARALARPAKPEHRPIGFHIPRQK